MTTIEYYLNGKHLDGWDENDHDTIDIEAAADNLTDWDEGDLFVAVLIDGDHTESQSLRLHTRPKDKE